MPKWKILQLKIRLENKLHIGGLQLGVVEQTQRWIPGKNLWGALTSVLTRSIMENYSAAEYHVIGNLLKKYVRFTYFYVLEKENEQEFVLLPKYTETGLEYQKVPVDGQTLPVGCDQGISDYIFENRYIGSYTSTALDYESMTAENNSLHEIEYITPDTSFYGYMFYNLEGLQTKDIDEQLLLDMIENHLGLQGLGGSRSRGFGKVQVKPTKVTDSTLFETPQFTGYELNLTQDELLVTLQPGEHATFLPIGYQAGADYIDFKGDLAPIVGREWGKDRGAGQKLSQSQCVILPGSTFTLVQPKEMQLTYEGILVPRGCEG